MNNPHAQFEVEELYKENVLDHYKNPRNAGQLSTYTIKHTLNNPSCGDRIDLYLLLEDSKLADFAFDGTGCAVSMAASSLLTEHLKGKPLAEIRTTSEDAVLALLGIPVGPSRMKCAMLCLRTLEEALNEHPAV